MKNQTDTQTLLELYRQGPSIRIYVDIQSLQANWVLPPGNSIAMLLFTSLIETSLALDQIELLGAMSMGSFNGAHYAVFVEASKIGVAALILKGLIETHLPFAFHLVEIVEADGVSSTEISRAGEGWGSLEDRTAWSIKQGETAGESLAAELPKAHANCLNLENHLKNHFSEADRQISELRARIEKMERNATSGDEWKNNSEENGGAAK